MTNPEPSFRPLYQWMRGFIGNDPTAAEERAHLVLQVALSVCGERLGADRVAAAAIARAQEAEPVQIVGCVRV